MPSLVTIPDVPGWRSTLLNMQEPPSPEPADRDDEAPAGAVRPVDLRDYVRFSEDQATCSRVFTSDRLALDLWCIEPQQATPVLHEADRDITYVVVGGRSWFVTDAGEIGLDPMGSMLVPAGTVHAVDNRAPDPLIIVATSSPPAQQSEAAPEQARALAVRAQVDEPRMLRRLVESLLGSGRSGSPPR